MRFLRQEAQEPHENVIGPPGAWPSETRQVWTETPGPVEPVEFLARLLLHDDSRGMKVLLATRSTSRRPMNGGRWGFRDAVVGGTVSCHALGARLGFLLPSRFLRAEPAQGVDSTATSSAADQAIRTVDPSVGCGHQFSRISERAAAFHAHENSCVPRSHGQRAAALAGGANRRRARAGCRRACGGGGAAEARRLALEHARCVSDS
jgi:hypothetical protein